MRKLKVLVIFSSSELGGAERSLTRMALAGRSSGVFDLATLDGEGEWSDWYRSLGGEPIVLGSRNSFDTHGRVRLRALFRLIRQVRKNHYDAIYVIGLRASFLLRLVKPLLCGVTLVHGVRWNPDSDSRLDRYFRLIERFAHPLMDAWIVNSKIAKKTLHERCKIPYNKIYVIYNGVIGVSQDIPGVNDRSFEVLTVANLSPRKGYIEYLRVIQRLVSKYPRLRFVFIGRDDMKGRLQKLIRQYGLEDNVHYEGFQKDVSRWYKRAKLFVLPSLWGEGCPTSILEAFSYKLPVVAFAIDGIPELVTSGVDGFLVRPYDEENFAKAIEKILCNYELASQMGVLGWRKVKTNFSLKICAEQHIECFSNLVCLAQEGKDE